MSTLHYRCSFDLTAEHPEGSWETLLKLVRKWIAKRPTPDVNEDFWNSWFFQGGYWESRLHPGIHVLTRNCYGACSRERPNCWAAEYEHPCDEFPGRRFWRIHIGIEQFDRSQFHLNCQTLYDVRPGYLGPEPFAPLPSPPGLITTLLRSRSWRCMAGREELGTCARVLRVGEGHLFAELIANIGRTCPVVLLSQIYCDRGCAIDPTTLARPLAGTAIVFKSETSEVDEELDSLLGEKFGCRKGAIRVYVPGLDFKRAGEERRHRFILPKNIEEWGLDETIEIIVRGIARRSTRPKGVLTPLDVEAVGRQRRLVQLRAKQNSASKDEWIQLLEQENETLNKRKAELENETIRFEEHTEELYDQIRRLEHERDSIKTNLARAGSPDDNGEKVAVTLDCFRGLPSSLSDVVEKIARIHSSHIAFTDKAIKSAREAECDVPNAWRALWAMATILYDVLLKREGGDKQRIFYDQSGFELAMTEGKLTNHDKKLKSLRKDTFMGQEIDITPHVKFDRANTRAYFCPFQKNGTKLIVVGHIGNHLDTAGTRRQRGR